MKRIKKWFFTIKCVFIAVGLSFCCYAEKIASAKENNGPNLLGALMLGGWFILAVILTHKVVYPIHRKHFLSSVDKTEEEILLSNFDRANKRFGMWLQDFIGVFIGGGLILAYIIGSIIGK